MLKNIAKNRYGRLHTNSIRLVSGELWPVELVGQHLHAHPVKQEPNDGEELPATDAQDLQV